MALNSFNPLNWKLQRLTGALLFILVIYHFLDQHLLIEATMKAINPALAGSHVTDPALLNCKWAISVDHVTKPFYIFTYALFLLAALYHGLGGIRLFLLDLGWSDKAQKLLFYILAAVGVGFAVMGLHTLISPDVPAGFDMNAACSAVAK
jgi:succinate dehydrogenase hydrophobic anchor subunit